MPSWIGLYIMPFGSRAGKVNMREYCAKHRPVITGGIHLRIGGYQNREWVGTERGSVLDSFMRNNHSSKKIGSGKHLSSRCLLTH
jgi:hypothetical protein